MKACKLFREARECSAQIRTKEQHAMQCPLYNFTHNALQMYSSLHELKNIMFPGKLWKENQRPTAEKLSTLNFC